MLERQNNINHKEQRRMNTAPNEINRKRHACARFFMSVMKKSKRGTFEHQKRVAHIAEGIAKEMDLDEKQIEDIYLSALSHDIGKIAIPNRILDSNSRLNWYQNKVMKSHVKVGKFFLKKSSLKDIADFASWHHEKLDGSGYFGLKGEEIPLSARIVAVADVFDAMINGRSYHDGYSLKEIFIELRDVNKYNQNVVSALEKYLKNNGYDIDGMYD